VKLVYVLGYPCERLSFEEVRDFLRLCFGSEDLSVIFERETRPSFDVDLEPDKFDQSFGDLDPVWHEFEDVSVHEMMMHEMWW
jgi:hypothetical protein